LFVAQKNLNCFFQRHLRYVNFLEGPLRLENKRTIMVAECELLLQQVLIGELISQKASVLVGGGQNGQVKVVRNIALYVVGFRIPAWRIFNKCGMTKR